MNKKIGSIISRKFIVTIIIIISATILLMNNIINSDNWVDVVEVIGASYIVGNVAHNGLNSYLDNRDSNNG